MSLIDDSTGKMRKLNWSPPRPDFRDMSYRMVESVEAMRYPHQADLRPQMSPVEDQGEIGSCSAQALSACVEHLELMEIALEVDKIAQGLNRVRQGR